MTRPTNVLFILSDEHTRRVLGSYGNRIVRTPHLDALATRGTRFASAYCQTPICVPSRGSLATGRWPHAIDSWDNATPYVGTEVSSWGHRLTAQGHRVATVGKLHDRRADDPSGFSDQRVPLHVVDGTGDLYGLLRGDMPPRPQSLRRRISAFMQYVAYLDGKGFVPPKGRGCGDAPLLHVRVPESRPARATVVHRQIHSPASANRPEEQERREPHEIVPLDDLPPKPEQADTGLSCHEGDARGRGSTVQFSPVLA